MKSGLRDVLYGPAGVYMRRETPYALVAPEFGTRADRAQDPAVRAAPRKRLQADGGDHALEIFDLDAAGERLWVDENAPGASDTAVRQADLAQGVAATSAPRDRPSPAVGTAPPSRPRTCTTSPTRSPGRASAEPAAPYCPSTRGRLMAPCVPVRIYRRTGTRDAST
ncbi:hypothetical protein [Brachybacterium sp. GPGPB12]|uniref:hypothetical protein n=1 Tax=Brachybacterium sp. GPGPB12 TaxID=3023517 RepID=UPI0031345424